MTLTQIKQQFAKLDKQSSQLTDKFIAAGRGHETAFEILKKDDELARQYREQYEQRMTLVIECEQRFGPDWRMVVR